MLPTVRDQHLGRRRFVARIANGLLSDRFPQFGHAGGGSVLVHLRVTTCSDRRFNYVIGGREVGFPGAEADDVDALGT